MQQLTKFKKTELGEIPEDWEIKKVGELLNEKTILQIQDGNHGELHPKLADFIPKGIPFLTANCVVNNRISFDNCKYLSESWLKKLRIGFATANDVILTHKGTLGLCAIVPADVKDIILSPQTTYYRLSDRITYIFLFYFFQSSFFQNKLLQMGRQSTRDYVGITSQKSLTVILPPIKEQQKIASILSKVDELIQRTDQIIEQTQILKKGLMQRLLTKGIGHTKFKKVKLLSLIIHIPDEWELKSLDEVSSITRLAGYEYTEYWKPDINGSVIALRGFNIQENKLDLNDVERISEKLSNQLIRSKLNKGDVVFPCVGSIGKAALIREDGKYHINQNIAKITAGDKLNPLFLTYFLLSEITRHQISSYNASTSQPNVLVGNLRKFLIPLPSLPEQDKINRIITPIYSLLESEMNHRVNVLKLKKGLMQQLLTGKIRVTI